MNTFSYNAFNLLNPCISVENTLYEPYKSKVLYEKTNANKQKFGFKCRKSYKPYKRSYKKQNKSML